MARRQKGFTLLEVMIALTIFSVIAVTISSTTSQSVNNVLYLEEKVLATWVAENHLVTLSIKAKASQSLLPQTETKDTVEMAGREWQVSTKVEKTDFPGVQRVTVSVALQRDKEYNLSSIATIMGAR